MQDKCCPRDVGVDFPIPLSTLQGLRHPRLLPRSIAPSFSLQSQLLGAEFCASISAAMAGLTMRFASSDYAPTREVRPSATPGERSLAAVLLHDLSAHYGSHALRRAKSHPLGPCYRSRRRRLSSGFHDGRRRLWSLRAAHRLWCRRCGVYLVTGVTKKLFGRSVSSLSHFSDNDDDTAATAVGGALHSVEKNRVSRGFYLCCRCLDEELMSCRGGKSEVVLSHPMAPHVVKRDKQSGSVSLNGESYWMNDLSALCVGKTCRRKRKRREPVVATVESADASRCPMEVTKIATKGMPASDVTVHAIPKGSLTRGKRGRREEAKESVDLVKKGKDGEAGELWFSGRRGRGDSGDGPVRKEARLREETTADPKPHPSAMEAKTRGVIVTATRPTPGVLSPPAPPKGRRPAQKKNKNSSGAPSANSFTDTMSRLGL